MITSSNFVHETLYSRFVDNFNLVDINGNSIEYVLGLEEGDFTSESNICLNATEFDSRQHTLGQTGTRRYERSGLISIKVRSAIKNGQYPMDDMIDRLLGLFEGVTVSGVHTFNSRMRLGDSDGYYSVKILTIDYSYHFIK